MRTVEGLTLIARKDDRGSRTKCDREGGNDKASDFHDDTKVKDVKDGWRGDYT